MPVQARVERPEAEGCIRGHATAVNRGRMDEGHVAFVQAALSDTKSPVLNAFNEVVFAIS